MSADQTSRPSALLWGTGGSPLLLPVAVAGATVLLFRLGSGHTEASQRFADRPEFDIWVWVLAAEVAAAAAVGIATWPAFRVLVGVTGRRAVVLAVVTWLAVGFLVLFGPRALTSSVEYPFWLLFARVTACTIVVGVLISPSFLGLLLTQRRLAALKQEVPPSVAQDRAGRVIVELIWVRAAMQRFLLSFALVITGAVLSAGALRAVLIADGAAAGDFPVARILIYGGFFAALSALAFVPAYVAWQERVGDLRDQLYPFPDNGLPPHDWHQARQDFDTLLSAQSGAGKMLAAAFGILAPLVSGLISTLLPD